MGIVRFLIITTALIFSGTVIQLLFLKKVKKHLEIISLSFPIGMGLAIVFIFLSSPLLDISGAFGVFVLLSLLAGLVIKGRLRNFFANSSKNLRKLIYPLSLKVFLKNKLTLFLFALLFLIVGVSFYKNITWPITDWDALTSYDYFAKLWYKADSLNTFKKGILTTAHGLNWPLFNSIMHIFSYWAFGLGNQGKLYYSVLLLFFTLIVLSNFREKWSINKSLLFTAFLVTTPLWGQSLMAYTNFPFSVYFATSLIYLDKLMQRRDNKFNLFVSLLLFLISIWVRWSFYAFHIFTAVAVGILAIRRKELRLIPVVLVVLVLFTLKSWGLISHYHFSQMDLTYSHQFAAETKPGKPLLIKPPSGYIELFTDSDFFTLSRFWEVAPFTLNIFQGSVRFYIFVYLVVVLHATNSLKKLRGLFEKESFLGLWVAISLFTLFVGIWVSSITMYRYWDQISGSAVRMISFLPPIILYYTLMREDLVKEVIKFLDRAVKRFRAR